MNLRNFLTLLGTALFALGDEMKTNGKTEMEWRVGRYASVVGVVLIGARGVPEKARRKTP